MPPGGKDLRADSGQQPVKNCDLWSHNYNHVSALRSNSSQLSLDMILAVSNPELQDPARPHLIPHQRN